MADASEAAHAVPHLDDGVVAEILHRLPTKDAYRAAAVCPRWRAVVTEPVFLSRHLAPRPLPLLDDGPRAVILQPRRKVGYTHLTLVATDPAGAGPVDLNVPLDPKYTDESLKSSCAYKSPKPPTPGLLDTAADSFVLSRLYSTGTDDDEIWDDDAPEEHDQLAGGAAVEEARDDNAVEEPDQPAAGDDVTVGEAVEADVPGAEAAPPPLPVEVPDHVAFFERTVPILDISFVASHGRLLLARSRTRYYVCDPAANRWVALPPSSFPPTHDAAPGLHYDLDAATGWVSFTVVLLVRLRRRRLLVETFSSATGRWDRNVLDAPGVARRLGVASQGIHVGTCFYWLCRRDGRVIRYDVARRRASVVRDPPEAEGSDGRACRSLGSAGGRLRYCAFDIRDEHSGSMLPHDDIEGVHGVWVMDPGAGAWRRVHEAVVEDLSAWYFKMVWGLEKAVEFPGACGGAIIVDQNKHLLRYDLESGDKVKIASLYRNDGRLGALYGRYHAFPFFGSG
ncbi:hypothetical protein ACP70R_030661 [Stipagrostis hirtigluma subsp. patula]